MVRWEPGPVWFSHHSFLTSHYSILITHFSNSIFSLTQTKTCLVSYLGLHNSKFCTKWWDPFIVLGQNGSCLPALSLLFLPSLSFLHFKSLSFLTFFLSIFVWIFQKNSNSPSKQRNPPTMSEINK